MKKILFLALFVQIAYGQSQLERQKIVATYNKKKIENLKSSYEFTHAKQQKLITDFKRSNRFSRMFKGSLERIDNGFPIFFTEDNAESAITLDATSLYDGGSLGLNLTGNGVVAGVWDGGKVRNTHREFTSGRVVVGDDASSPSEHGTHVTGTILSAGIDSRSKGIAYGASAKTYFWDNDLGEMIQFAGEGYLVSNHSYGYSITNLQNWRFGTYDQTSVDYDKIAEVMPYYQIVKAAGNDRNLIHPQIIAKGGYDMLTGAALSKNVLVVAAVNHVPLYSGPGSVVISSFSNWGPTDDGRIKPDISSKGLSVYSTTVASDSSYGLLSGTSMAAPSIVGLICLLQQHFNNINKSFMKSATVRGLICHTALETGASIGPDYEFGWGLANAKAAAKLISNNGSSTLITEQTLNNNTIFTRNISISTSQPLSVSVAWTDPASTVTSVSAADADNRVSKLVNNLDLEITKDGVVYYPWKLNPDVISQPATNSGPNDVDNIEKVFIENAAPGTYTITVKHRGTLIGGSQEFSLIADAASGLTLSNEEFAIEKSIQIYPNPAQDFVSFSLPSEFNLKTIKVYDVLGKEVLSTNEFSNNQLRISSLNKGIYLITFVSDAATVTSKFIKE